MLHALIQVDLEDIFLWEISLNRMQILTQFFHCTPDFSRKPTTDAEAGEKADIDDGLHFHFRLPLDLRTEKILR